MSDWPIYLWLGGLTAQSIAVEWRNWRTFRPARALITAETERKVAHTKAFEKLTDPEAIADEFEASGERNAKQLEALQANRITEPREGAGPHAIIHRPRKMRPVTPRRWNPPADYSDRVRAMTEKRNRGEGY
ncbi:gp68 [Mycobacterium phage Barnyard]|uniref:Uncharacterized protein n=1 Tax=Mycobacterium phage Barnyard TaxID=205880 RepID=Q856A4_9CAUD|nr:gp68 [Mycobacterium phage Barnyard]AAN02122.1 hypothetical protein PBI_BARNYARD_68 [Mycobacterium phage Barnyard]